MTGSLAASAQIDVHLDPSELALRLRREARIGLTSSPKELAPTWFYDEVGCDLFDRITMLPEYYPTRAERSILHEHATSIASISNADTLIELGSGSCDKTRLLLDAFTTSDTFKRYVPFDVAEPTLRTAAEQIAAEYQGLVVAGVVGDLRDHLHLLPAGGRRMIAILGGTIGNFKPPARSALLLTLSSSMEPGDTLLVGTDLVKNRDRLVCAYDDAAGVTAAFNLNVLIRLNRELGADFDIGQFAHVAVFDEANEWIEMRLRSLADQTVRIAQLGLTLRFVAGEEMRTEISAKFTPGRWDRELTAAGLHPFAAWSDPARDYVLSLAQK
jgi:L-histidine Nalpha-methyltransferase